MQVIANFLHDQYHSTEHVRIKEYFVPYHGTGWFPSTLPAKRNVFVKNYVMAGEAPRKHRIPSWFTYEDHAGGLNLCGLLRREGHSIGRRHVSTLMTRMGIEAVYRKPYISQPRPAEILRGVS
jgi:hypothetical protein